MAAVAPGTTVPLEAPTSLLVLPSAPNSARVLATGASLSGYVVTLFDCPTPLPVNAAGIGSGSCGAMGAFDGEFGGQAYPSVAAARAAVTPPPGGPLGCDRVSRVALQPGVTATLYAAPPPQGNCQAVWHQGSWTFTLSGDLNGGVSGDPTEPWPLIAKSVVAFVGRHRPPPTPGWFTCDVAADGLHTDLRWARGADVYTAGAFHQAIPALGLAIAMSPYPG